jgi:hypothetical protein
MEMKAHEIVWAGVQLVIFEPGNHCPSTCVRGFLPSPYSKTALSVAVFFALRNFSLLNFKLHPATCHSTSSASLMSPSV